MATCVESSVKNIALSEIRIDGGTQCRVELNEEVVAEYSSRLVGSFEFEPATIFFDGSSYWMADGFHRYFAYQKSHFDAMPCDIREGTKEEAQWYAYGANQIHGLRRTNADKQRAVELALKHPRGVELSDRQIADHVGVDHKTVSKHRADAEATGELPQSDVRIGKDGRKLKTSSAKRSESAKRKNAAKKKDEPAKPSNVEPDEPLEFLEEFDETREELESAAECEREDETEAQDTAQETPEVAPVVRGPVIDRLKRKVPEQFEEVFAGDGVFDELRTSLNQLKDKFQALCGSKLGAFMHWQTVEADINNLKSALKFGRPYTVCPYCKGSGCKACKHQGWITEDGFRSAPREMK